MVESLFHLVLASFPTPFDFLLLTRSTALPGCNCCCWCCCRRYFVIRIITTTSMLTLSYAAAVTVPTTILGESSSPPSSWILDSSRASDCGRIIQRRSADDCRHLHHPSTSLAPTRLANPWCSYFLFSTTTRYAAEASRRGSSSSSSERSAENEKNKRLHPTASRCEEERRTGELQVHIEKSFAC